jgi:Protein of unknown function (DUF4013)
MDIGEIVNDAIRYPSSDWKKVIIFGILFILSFLIIPLFLVIGYMFRIIKASIAGSDELPDFDEWGEMFIDGLKVFVVQIVYMIPALIILGISFVSIFASIGTLNAMQTAGTVASPLAAFSLFSGAAFAGIFIAGIYAIIVGLIVYMAIAYMAYYDGELGAAFRFREILDWIAAIGWVDYIIWYIVVIIIAAVVAFIAGIINLIPILGFIITILVIYPYLVMFVGRALALIFSTVELETTEEEPETLEKEPETLEKEPETSEETKE